MIESFIKNHVDKSELIATLKQRLTIERSMFEKRSATMDDLPRAQAELKLTKMEHFIMNLEDENSPDPDLKYHKVIEEFFGWDHAKTIEIINFLLAEFFEHSYPATKFESDFILEVVFETTRLTNFINSLKNINSKEN